MPKSFASSLLLRRSAFGACGLIALALLASGCGGTQSVHYTPDVVEAAFEDAGISLYSRGLGRSFGQGGSRDFRQSSASSRDTGSQPLTSLLEGIRDAVLIDTSEPRRTSAVLSGRYVLVYVYPGAADATRRADELRDILGAQEILDRPEFGFFRKGNVVVSYHVFNSNSYVPGEFGRWESSETIERRTTQQIAAAFSRLD
jgi:hypothetical protein